MVDLAYRPPSKKRELALMAEYARVRGYDQPRTIPFLKTAIFLGGFCAGMAFASHLTRNEYSSGVEAGRMEEQDRQASVNAKANSMIHANLCKYADLACGYYHNPTPERHHPK
jgi:hypothetical protein